MKSRLQSLCSVPAILCCGGMLCGSSESLGQTIAPLDANPILRVQASPPPSSVTPKSADKPALTPPSALSRHLQDLRPDLFTFTLLPKAAVPPPDPNIVVLPPFLVSRPHEHLPSASDVLTPNGLSDFLYQRYPGASFKGEDPVKSHAPNYAAMMYSDERRQEQYHYFHDLLDLAAGPKGKIDPKVQKELEQTFQRTETPLQGAMDRSYNAGRY